MKALLFRYLRYIWFAVHMALHFIYEVKKKKKIIIVVNAMFSVQLGRENNKIKIIIKIIIK